MFYNRSRDIVLTAITAAELYSASQSIASPLVIVEDEHILRITSQDAEEVPSSARLVSFDGAVLTPGFIDLHIHGASGCDVMEGDDEGLRRMAAFLAGHGVSSFLPTTVTADVGVLESAIARIAAQIEHWPADGLLARPIGIHLEGPCISSLRRGVHPLKDVRNPSLELLDRLYKAANGKLKLITIAPELPDALATIREAVARGVKVSIGHTDGDADDAVAAIEAGASHVTHTFNAMRPLEHRAPGVLGVALADARLSAEIIADGVHVDPRAVEIFLKCKGRERAVLVTDAISATGMPDGRYLLGQFEVDVKGQRAEHEGRLAGSVLTLDRAVQNIVHMAGWSLRDSVRLATTNPAQVLGESSIGVLQAQARADITVLSMSGEVLQSFIGGRPTRG